MQPDVLLLEGIGGGYTEATLQQRGLGGSEIEILQVARGLTARGHRVAIANGVDRLLVEGDITYVPHPHAWQHIPTRALYLQRWNLPDTRTEIGASVRVIVRANDLRCPPYDVHRPWLSSGRAALIANTKWQADSFDYATERIVIPPMLDAVPEVLKQRGLFVFGSGAEKGLEATLKVWCAFKSRHPALRGARLAIVSPGWGEPRPLTTEEIAAGIFAVGSPTPHDYRAWIAKAEGLFMVNTMIEVFCCAAALAERAGTRTHILATNGLGGLAESVQDQRYITIDPEAFETSFIDALIEPLGVPRHDLPDLDPAVVIQQWETALHLDRPPIMLTAGGFPPDPTLTSNQDALGPFFGEFLSTLRGALQPGGSEFGAGLMLFSLASAIQAKMIVEIGRFKGFSTFALAAACRLQDVGWMEPTAARQRPDVDYAALKRPARVLSIDPHPTPEAENLLDAAGLMRYVDFRNVRSSDVKLDQPIDLLFIDGGHGVADVRADVQQYVPLVRPGGYFILHDYFGWYQGDQNGSHIPTVIDEDLIGCDRVLIDTGYASLVVFRKAQRQTERWELDPKPSKMPARADGRPTVGLCVIAKGEEVATVATRAITSAQQIGIDCVTVVCDAAESTAAIARTLGADVFVRPTPPTDWERGIGWIAGARNEALAIAERRTDYVLMLDADDYLDGQLPDRFDHDAYEVTITDGSLMYRRLQLYRSVLGWRYRGIIHEVLETTSGASIGHLDGVQYRRGRSSYAYQDSQPAAVKYGQHAKLMQKWLIDHPDDPRAQFYYARSLHDAGQHEAAILAYQRRMANLQGWDEERAHSAYQIGRLLFAQGQDPTVPLLQAASIGVPKAEPLVALARWYRDDARKQFGTAMLFAKAAAEIPQPTAAIFCEPLIYQFEAAAEVAICAYWLGDKGAALRHFEALAPRVPPDRRAWITEQLAICRR